MVIMVDKVSILQGLMVKIMGRQKMTLLLTLMLRQIHNQDYGVNGF
jgi:hypothetical protein